MLTSPWNPISLIFCNSSRYSDVNSLTSMQFLCRCLAMVNWCPSNFFHLSAMKGTTSEISELPKSFVEPLSLSYYVQSCL